MAGATSYAQYQNKLIAQKRIEDAQRDPDVGVSDVGVSAPEACVIRKAHTAFTIESIIAPDFNRISSGTSGKAGGGGDAGDTCSNDGSNDAVIDVTVCDLVGERLDQPPRRTQCLQKHPPNTIKYDQKHPPQHPPQHPPLHPRQHSMQHPLHRPHNTPTSTPLQQLPRPAQPPPQIAVTPLPPAHYILKLQQHQQQQRMLNALRVRDADYLDTYKVTARGVTTKDATLSSATTNPYAIRGPLLNHASDEFRVDPLKVSIHPDHSIRSMTGNVQDTICHAPLFGHAHNNNAYFSRVLMNSYENSDSNIFSSFKPYTL